MSRLETLVLGKEIKKFVHNEVKNGLFYDDSESTLKFYDENGNWILKDNEQYDIKKCGRIGDVKNSNITKPFYLVFGKWILEKETISIEINKDKKQEIVAKLKEMGCKIL